MSVDSSRSGWLARRVCGVHMKFECLLRYALSYKVRASHKVCRHDKQCSVRSGFEAAPGCRWLGIWLKSRIHAGSRRRSYGVSLACVCQAKLAEMSHRNDRFQAGKVHARERRPPVDRLLMSRVGSPRDLTLNCKSIWLICI